MTLYILETLAFQLVFLLVYDLILKKETFFQLNRIYLLGTFVLSTVLPWVKIEALKTTISQEFIGFPLSVLQLGEVEVGTHTITNNFWESIPMEYWMYGVGALAMLLWFVAKLYRIKALKERGTVRHYDDFVKVTIPKSKVAFSFFKNVFLGADIKPSKQKDIIAHERVHIRQWHSLDQLFFELMRIVFWFNPLVYVQQARLTELHEFIADAKVAKTDKKKQYELLLSDAFQTQNISFVNPFFKKSLIKKRIVMLGKQQSKNVWRLKYAVLLPLVLGMLVYTSCEGESRKSEVSLTAKLSNLNKEIESRDSLSKSEREEILKMAEALTEKMNQSQKVVDGWKVRAGVNYAVAQGSAIPFGVIDEAPIFPGCESTSNTKECFLEKIQEHIRKHFNYPKEARDQGIQGQVNVMFTIAEDGSIIDVKKRGPHPLLEDEVERIIKRLPLMQPGKHNGTAVKVPFSIPVTFKLD